MTPLDLKINGQQHIVGAPSHWTLLEVLRYRLGLTGSKQGCDKGDCGACTVLIDGQPQLACCVVAGTVTGEITTIEGLADPTGPTDVQRAFDVLGALQCGFCQPGMLLSAAALLEEEPDPSRDQIREALSGNLCRCTGYTKILDAVELAAKARKGDPEAKRLTSNDVPMAYGPPAEGFRAIGARARKADSIRKATGEEVFTDDLTLPGMLHAKLLRSPHAHARILSIDTSAAEALPGVLGVMVGSELPKAYCVIPWTPDETALCVDKVRFVGDPLACVAAVDEDTANAALDLIQVEYEVLGAVLDPKTALDEGTPLVHDTDWKGRTRRSNLCKKVELEFGDVDAQLEAAAARVKDTWEYAGSTHAPIEPHCAIARWDGDGNLTLWSSTQVPHYLHRTLADVLEVPQHAIRVIQPTVGGAFGGKSEPFDLELCVAHLARKTGRAVKLLYTREELFYSHRGRHPITLNMELAADAEGRLLAVDSDALLDGGAYHSFGLITTYYAGQLLTGPVDMATYRFNSRRVYTNKPPCGPKRGHGSVQPRFAFETALDELGEKLGIDPIEIRRVNALTNGSTTVNGQFVPSTGLNECLDVVARESRWAERHGKLPYGHGLGVACSMYISGTAYPIYPNDMPQSGVTVRTDRSGRLTVMCGVSEIGQGCDGMLATVISEETGVPPERISVVSGDSVLAPVDLGAYSSRITLMAGNAAMEAGRRLQAKLLAAAQKRWESPAKVGRGYLYDANDPGRQVDITQALIWAEEDEGCPVVASGGFRTSKLGGDYRGGSIGASPAYSTTAHVAEAHVDPKTGVIHVSKIWAAHDCGRAVNPTLVEGQIEGSVYMGWCEAMFEHQAFRDNGLHIGPSLLDYPIATSVETPEIFAHIVETVDPKGPYGAKEAGEGPLHPAIPAIANAVYDAIGVRLRTMPFTPERVKELLKC